MSIFDPVYIDHQTDTKVSPLVLNRLDKDKFDQLSSHSPDEIWFIQDSELSGQPIVVDTRPVNVPTNLSELSNDVGYCTSAYVTSRGYATESWVNNKNYATQSYVQTYVADHASKTAWRDWRQEEYDPRLTFTAEEANSTVAMAANGSAPSVSLEYSTDSGTTWNDFIVGTTVVALPNAGDKMILRAKTTNSTFATNASNYNKFVMTGKIAASNSIMYLLKNDGDLDTIPSSCCFQDLFNGCTPLTQAPELPATTLASDCYQGMFRGCTSLTQAPELPATTLSFGCYEYMFYGCTSLTYTPYLPATTLASVCYMYMFVNCSSLNEIKIAYTGNFSGTGVPSGAFFYWVQGVGSSGTFYYNGSDTTRGTSAIPSNWTIQTF